MGCMDYLERRIMSIIETNFGHKLDPKLIAKGLASNVSKKGAFFTFELRVDGDDIREYSFTDRNRALAMRKIMIEHLESRMRLNYRRTA